MRIFAGVVLVAALAILPSKARAVCKYIDAEGNVHFTNVAPENGWKKLSCGIGEDAIRNEAASEKSREKAWSVARKKIKIGMTEQEMLDADPLLRAVRSRKVTESASGKDEWLSYGGGFDVQLHNGRVTIIRY